MNCPKLGFAKFCFQLLGQHTLEGQDDFSNLPMTEKF